MSTHAPRRAGAGLLALLLALCMTAQALAASLPDFTDLAERVGPSVVNISTKTAPPQPKQRPGQRARPGQRPEQGPGQGQPRNPMEEFFRDFFGDQMPQRRPQSSLGSGFIISEDGYIVTNNHVVAEADSIEVTLDGNTKKTFPAKVIGADPETDLALIKIEPGQKLKPLTWGDSTVAKVGEWVVAIGNPFGLDHSVTAGIISAKGRVIGAGPYDNFIQTDASINPGNSGGPLLNLAGEVIGINTAIVAAGQGIGFAVPSSTAKEVLAQLRSGGEVKRGLLGVRIQDVDDATAKALGLKEARGALVAAVTPGSPAAEAGIRQGDVVTSVDGRDIGDSRELTRIIGAMSPGAKVNLGVWRQGSQKSYAVTLAKRTREALAENQTGKEESGDAFLGMSVRPPNEQEAKALSLKPGQGLLVTDVDAASKAADAGVLAGDVILEVNQKPVASAEALRKLLAEDAKKKGAALFLLQRRGQALFVTVPVE